MIAEGTAFIGEIARIELPGLKVTKRQNTVSKLATLQDFEIKQCIGWDRMKSQQFSTPNRNNQCVLTGIVRLSF